jgi:cytoskeletal protein CcmA (bactofilin family)
MFFKKKESLEGVLSSSTIITKGTTNKGDLLSQDTVYIYGVYEGNVKAPKVVVHGLLNGTVLCENLVIERGGVVKEKMQAKEIVVSGIIQGEVSAMLLITKESASVNGNLYIKSIQNEGGNVKGNISEYREVVEDIFIIKEEVMKELDTARKKPLKLEKQIA